MVCDPQQTSVSLNVETSVSQTVMKQELKYMLMDSGTTIPF